MLALITNNSNAKLSHRRRFSKWSKTRSNHSSNSSSSKSKPTSKLVCLASAGIRFCRCQIPRVTPITIMVAYRSPRYTMRLNWRVFRSRQSWTSLEPLLVASASTWCSSRRSQVWKIVESWVKSAERLMRDSKELRWQDQPSTQSQLTWPVG